MATLAGPIKLAPGANVNATGIDFIPITVSGADVDLTSPSGPTGGFAARSVQIGVTGGNLVCVTFASAGTGTFGGSGSYTLRTIPVAANTVVPVGVAYICGSANGTTATPIGVFL